MRELEEMRRQVTVEEVEKTIKILEKEETATRAKQNLYITYPMNIFDRHNGMTLSKPSRFIAEISEELAEEWLLEEDF